jgi:hypothetical protein
LNVVGALRQSVAQWCADGFGDGSKWLIGTAITNDKGGAIAIPQSLRNSEVRPTGNSTKTGKAQTLCLERPSVLCHGTLAQPSSPGFKHDAWERAII